MRRINLARGKHLFFKFQGKSRTGLSFSVAVLVRNQDAQPGQMMTNVSESIADSLGVKWNPIKDAAILHPPVDSTQETLGPWLCSKLGVKLHADASAFTWEWI